MVQLVDALLYVGNRWWDDGMDALWMHDGLQQHQQRQMEGLMLM